MAKKDKKILEETNPFGREEAIGEDTPTILPEVEKTEVVEQSKDNKDNILQEEGTNTMKPNIDYGPRFIFYYGFYSVNHSVRKGQYMEPLHTKTGETRTCPCPKIAISLENAYDLIQNGYILKNSDPKLFQGRSITKRNVDKYITYITNMIENGFLSQD